MLAPLSLASARVRRAVVGDRRDGDVAAGRARDRRAAGVDLGAYHRSYVGSHGRRQSPSTKRSVWPGHPRTTSTASGLPGVDLGSATPASTELQADSSISHTGLVACQGVVPGDAAAGHARAIGPRSRTAPGTGRTPVGHVARPRCRPAMSTRGVGRARRRPGERSQAGVIAGRCLARRRSVGARRPPAPSPPARAPATIATAAASAGRAANAPRRTGISTNRYESERHGPREREPQREQGRTRSRPPAASSNHTKIGQCHR